MCRVTRDDGPEELILEFWFSRQLGHSFTKYSISTILHAKCILDKFRSTLSLLKVIQKKCNLGSNESTKSARSQCTFDKRYYRDLYSLLRNVNNVPQETSLIVSRKMFWHSFHPRNRQFFFFVSYYVRRKYKKSRAGAETCELTISAFQVLFLKRGMRLVGDCPLRRSVDVMLVVTLHAINIGATSLHVTP